jgi:hypothetical protein
MPAGRALSGGTQPRLERSDQITTARCQSVRLIVSLLAALIAWPAQAATPLDELIEPKKDHSACFQRIYDAAHLRRHAKQATTAMTVWLRYEAMRGTSDLALGFGIAISRRGDALPFFAQGDCYWDEKANRNVGGGRLIDTLNENQAAICMIYARPDVFDVLSAQEGGYLLLDRGKNRDTLMVYLDDSMIMVKRANRSEQLDVEFGTEDRAFLLQRTDLKNCAAVENAVTKPEPGVAPRQR